MTSHPKPSLPSSTKGDGCTPYFVYIARCADATFYTGITTDVPRRMEEHNSGKGARYTRSRRPVECVYFEEAASRSAALVREAAIKRLSRAEKLSLIGS